MRQVMKPGTAQSAITVMLSVVFAMASSVGALAQDVDARAMFRYRSFLVLAALIISGAPVILAHAAEHEGETAHEASHDYHSNFLGVFAGVTDEGREEAVTLGIEYERRDPRWCRIRFRGRQLGDFTST